MEEVKNTATHELKTLKLAINMFTDMQNNMFFIDNKIVTTLNKRNRPPKMKLIISPRKGKIFCT